MAQPVDQPAPAKAKSTRRTAAGLLIADGWPENSVWILGLLLSIDLIFQGVMHILLALALRRPRT